MNRRRIYDDELFAHFVTFSCSGRRRFLDLDRPKRIVLGTLEKELRRSDGACAGFVVMPNHVHAIVRFSEPNRLLDFIKEWKRSSSRAIADWYAASKIAYADEAPISPVWERGFYSFEIETPEKLEEKLDYLHLNPVRAGLCSEAIDWRWSSARWYLGGQSVGVSIDRFWKDPKERFPSERRPAPGTSD